MPRSQLNVSTVSMRSEWPLLLIILAVALILRVWGIGFGLPFSYSFDEYHEVMRALELGSGRFNFERTGKGGLYFVLLFEYGVYFVLLKAAGILDTAMDFAMHFVRDQTPFYLIGRWTVAIVGTINVLAVYLLGRKAYSVRAGIFAAAFLAVNTLHAYESHTVNVDIPMITLATFSLLYAIKLADSGIRRHYYFAALLAGLAVTTKLPALLLAVPLFFAHAIYCHGSGLGVRYTLLSRSLWVGGFILIGTVIVTNPGIVVTFPRIVSGVLANVAGTAELVSGGNGDSAAFPPNLHVYYFEKLTMSMGWPMLISALASVAYAVWRRCNADLILLSFAFVLYYLFTGPIAGEMYYARYFLPIIVVLVVLAGRLIDELLSMAGRPATKSLVLLAAGVMVIIPGYQAVVQNMVLAGPDTRTLAKQWIEENVPQGSRIAIEGGKIAPIRTTVQLQDSLESIERRIAHWKEVEPRQARYLEIRRRVMLEDGENSETTFELYFVRLAELRELAFYKSEGVEYFVLRPERFVEHRQSVTPHSGDMEFLVELRASPDVTLVYAIEPEIWHGVRGGGPAIEVYQLELN